MAATRQKTLTRQRRTDSQIDEGHSSGGVCLLRQQLLPVIFAKSRAGDYDIFTSGQFCGNQFPQSIQPRGAIFIAEWFATPHFFNIDARMIIVSVQKNTGAMFGQSAANGGLAGTGNTHNNYRNRTVVGLIHEDQRNTNAPIKSRNSVRLKVPFRFFEVSG